ncbi:reverse transcriptase domain-containing protein [Tanacetum coccineum]
MGNSAEWPMPVWCRMFQQTLDGKARAWFDKLSSGSIDSWDDLEEKLLNSIPKTIDEMLRRVDDYVRSEEAFRNTELPKGEFQKKGSCGQFPEEAEAKTAILLDRGLLSKVLWVGRNGDKKQGEKTFARQNREPS